MCLMAVVVDCWRMLFLVVVVPVSAFGLSASEEREKPTSHRWISGVLPTVARTLREVLVLVAAAAASTGSIETAYSGAARPWSASALLCHNIWGVSILMILVFVRSFVII